jgi:DNA invertase Pin-like site-specific DNA recombinase
MAGTRKTRLAPGNLFVAYYRVSDVKQGISRLGLEAQRDSVSRYLLEVKGVLAGEYTEVETGKRHGKRPELASAIALSKRRHATLLIAKLDRLARNVHFISGLMESATNFVALDVRYANRLTLHVMAAMAEHEGEMISERTAAGLAVVQRELAEKGFRISPRSGRRFEKLGNPRWEESIARATAARRKQPAPNQVRSIVAGYRAEGLSLRQIAARLNELGLKTFSKARWHASSVRKALLPV